MRLAERRRALIMAQNKQENVLPSGYTKLNYIESTGTQWIDLKYNCLNDYTPYRIKCKFKMTYTIRGQEVFGTNRENQSGLANVIYLSTSAGNEKFLFSRFGNTGAGIRFALADTEVHEFEYIFNEGIYFDNIFIEGSEANASIKNISSGVSMGLFARINGDGINASRIAICKIFGFELYGENNKPHRIFIPAQRNSDGEIGIYDIVTNTFFTNSGTGKFVGG